MPLAFDGEQGACDQQGDPGDAGRAERDTVDADPAVVSITLALTSCRAMRSAEVAMMPMRGPETVTADTMNTPLSPPSHIHQGDANASP